MSLFFVEGRAGVGKTDFLLEKIKENLHNDIKSILIVPEQISLETECRMIEKIGFVSERNNVLSFNRLFHTMYGESCGEKRCYVGKVGKTILMNRAIAKISSKLKVYTKSASYQEFAGQMLKTVSEFKRHSVSSDMLNKVSETIEGENTSEKIKDISLIYEKFNEYLYKKGADSDDNMSILKEMILKNSKLRDTDVFIDCFSSFTGEELAVVDALIKKAKNVYIAFTMDNSYIFEAVQNTLNMIENSAGKAEVIKLGENKKHTGALKYLAENYGNFRVKPYENENGGIEIYYCKNPEEECENVMIDIFDKVRRKGFKPGDIGILLSDTDVYENMLRRSFDRYGIPGYIEKSETLMLNRGGQFIISLLEAVNNRFSAESVMEFLKTGFTNINDDDICRIENYVLDIGIKGTKWFEPFSYKEEKYNLERLNEVRKEIANVFSDIPVLFKGRHNCSFFISGIKRFMERTDFKTKTEQLTKFFSKKGMPDTALKYRQVYNGIIEVLNQFEACLDGDDLFGTEKFTDMLKTAFNEYKISIIPPKNDCVMCLNPDSARHHSFEILYILGANNQMFPAPVSGSGIITDRERKILEANNVIIAPDNKRKTLELPYKIYELLCIPRKQLIISYSLANSEGGGLTPAPVVPEIKKMFRTEEKGTNDRPDDMFICTPKSSLRYALGGKADNKGVLKWYIENDKYRDMVIYILSARKYKIHSKISKYTARLLWGDEFCATVSRLEAFARCPFKYFAQYGLKLKERDTYDFNVMDRGTFTHKIMEDFVNYVIQNNIDWHSINEEKTDEIFEKIKDGSMEELEKVIPERTNAHSFLADKLQSTAKRAINAVVSQIAAGDFIPVVTELDISEDESIKPFELTTKEGRKVRLYGKIDRVDTADSSFRIIDYKSSDKSLKLSKVLEGSMLQLFVYSNVLRGKYKKPAGMFYFAVTPNLKEVYSVELKSENTEGFRLDGYMVGESDTLSKMDKNCGRTSNVVQKGHILSYGEYESFSEATMGNIRNSADRILDGDTEISPLAGSDTDKACNFCPYRSLCGFEDKYCRYRTGLGKTDSEILKEMRSKEQKNGD